MYHNNARALLRERMGKDSVNEEKETPRQSLLMINGGTAVTH
jgi:hypothetical protein